MSVRMGGEVATTTEQDWAPRLLAALGRHLDEERDECVYEYAAVKKLMPFMAAQRRAA